MARLASLVVDLQVQSAQLRAGLDEANRKIDGFAKKAAASTRSALDGIEQTAKQLKRVSAGLAQMSAPFAVAVAGAIAAAAKTNTEMASATKRSRDLLTQVGSEVGKAFLPAIESANGALAKLTVFLQQMDPETKKQIASWGMFALKGTALALVASKVFAALATLTEGAKLAGEAIASAFKVNGLVPFLAMLLGIVGAIGAIKKLFPEGTSFGGKGGASDAAAAKVTPAQRPLFGPTNQEIVGWIKERFFSPGKDAAGKEKSNLDVFGESVAEGIRPVMEPITKMIKEMVADLTAQWNKVDGAKAVIEKHPEFDVGTGADSGVNLAEISRQPAVGDVLGAVIKKREADENAYAAAISSALSGLADKFKSRLGIVSDLIDTARQGLDAGGPWGALAAVVADLFSRSSQFVYFVSKAAEIIGFVVKALGIILGPVLIPVFMLLKFVAQVIVGTIQAIQHAFDWIANLFGGDIDTSGIDQAMTDLNNLTWDQAEAAGAATEALEDFTRELSNVPEGFKTNAAIFNATAPVGGGTIQRASPAPVTNTFHINGITDPEEVAARVARIQELERIRRTGRSTIDGRFGVGFGL